MLGMSFLSFLLLTVIGGVVALFYHFVLRMKVLDGTAAIFAKVLIGWFGAWLGSPVLGHWWWKYENVYIVPALLGAIAAVHLNVMGWKALAQVLATRPTTMEETRRTEEIRKPTAA